MAIPRQPIKNDRLILALHRQPVDKTPIWIMRQAGRYLPEYRAVREKAGDFLTLCKIPELACQVTLQPIQRFDLDAAILFSDILTIPDAMGLGLYFSEGEGPRFSNPTRTLKDIQNLAVPDPEEKLSYVCKTIKLVQEELNGKVPLIGFSGSPWTLACYMVEGGSPNHFAKVKSLLYDDPKSFQILLDKLTEAVTLYLNAQIRAGVDVIMIFDTWGGVLTTQDYLKYSLAPMKKILEGLVKIPPNPPFSKGGTLGSLLFSKGGNWESLSFSKGGTRSHSFSKGETKGHFLFGGGGGGEGEGERSQKVPSILFTKGGGLWLEAMAQSGANALGLDWTVSLSEAKKRVGEKVALQGNLDPCMLYASPQKIRQAAIELLESYGGGPGHIFNLGHGIHPDVPIEHVEALVDAVHAYS